MKKYRIILVLVFVALITGNCRCSNDKDHPYMLPQTQGDPASCHYAKIFLEGGLWIGKNNYCFFYCPNGQSVQTDFYSYGLPVILKTEDYCSVDQMVAPPPTPTATATAQPTSTATATLVPTPMLTGEVTACSVQDGFINFKLVKDAPSITGNDVLVMMNGTQVTCTVAASNMHVLSCALPPGVTFPANISVTHGGAVANQFSFNGEGCSNAGPAGGDGSAPTPGLGD